MSNPHENLPEGVEGRAFAEFRATDDDGTEIEGHAATFDQPYRVRDFMEKVAPGAFDDVLEDDVFALVNHNVDKLLGRTSSGTLEIDVDDTGLWTRIQLPDTTDGENVRKLVERGDLSEMSFGFRVAQDGDTWEKMEDGTELRTIERVEELYDVSPVTMAANKFTDLAIRDALESRNRWHQSEQRDAEEDEADEAESQPESDDEYPALTREALDALRADLGMEAPTLEEMAERLEKHADVLRQRSKDLEGADEDEPADKTELDAGTLRRKLELEAAEAS